MSQSATLELAQEDPIRFRVGRLNHSAIAALRSYYFYLSVIVELLCGFYSLKVSRKYHFLAASDRFIKKLVGTENIHSEQDWNLSWMDLSNFYSDSVSTPPWLRFRISGFIGVGHPILNCCVTFFLFLEKLNIFLFRTFWRLDVVLNKGERKMSHSARFELALEDPIWFLVRRLNHSAMTAWSSFYFVLSVNVELLCGFYFLKNSRKYRFLAGSDRFKKK